MQGPTVLNSSKTATLSIHLITWNVFGSLPTEDLHEMLGLDQGGKGDQSLPDIFAIGLQELPITTYSSILGMMFNDPWTVAFKKILAGHDFVLMNSVRLGWMMLLLFIKRNHLLGIKAFQNSYTRTGFGGLLGNKGGVSETFMAYDTSVSIVNCHLAAHDSEGGHNQRIQDYHSIVGDQPFICTSDYVFWMGDTNFRISDYSTAQVDTLISQGKLKLLLEKDTLAHVIGRKLAFESFQEMPIRFKPTYKYSTQSTQYDLNRKPAWTDRILYKKLQAKESTKIIGKEYKTYENYLQSDHKPVSALFSITVGSSYVDSPVKFDPMDPWHVGQSGICCYTIKDNVLITSWDWIGLFKAKFSDVSEYVTWIYASPKSDNCTLRGIFHEVLVPEGAYLLLYFSGDTRELLGMSEPFQIIKKS